MLGGCLYIKTDFCMKRQLYKTINICVYYNLPCKRGLYKNRYTENDIISRKYYFKHFVKEASAPNQKSAVCLK